jgi:hypothetical protein
MPLSMKGLKTQAGLNIARAWGAVVLLPYTGVELEQQLWAVPVVGGQPRKFAEVTGEMSWVR